MEEDGNAVNWQWWGFFQNGYRPSTPCSAYLSNMMISEDDQSSFYVIITIIWWDKLFVSDYVLNMHLLHKTCDVTPNLCPNVQHLIASSILWCYHVNNNILISTRKQFTASQFAKLGSGTQSALTYTLSTAGADLGQLESLVQRHFDTWPVKVSACSRVTTYSLLLWSTNLPVRCLDTHRNEMFSSSRLLHEHINYYQKTLLQWW